LAGCWNVCIERARGEWVHLLHQDDWVLPGFYARFETLFGTVSGLDAAFARFLVADAGGHWQHIGFLERGTAGKLEAFDRLLATRQRMQCAAVIVKRATYERLGGFRADIPYVLDWEMWCRIAASGSWGYVPQPGAVYRRHPQSETERLQRSGKILRDIPVSGRIARANFSSELQAQTARAFQEVVSSGILDEVRFLHAHGRYTDALRLLHTHRREILLSKHLPVLLGLQLRALVNLLRAPFLRK
jgi:hypothetical protein